MSEQDTAQITFVFWPDIKIKQTKFNDLVLVSKDRSGLRSAFVITDGDRASHTDNSVTLKSGVVISQEKTEASELVHFESKAGPNYLPKNWITEIRGG